MTAADFTILKSGINIPLMFINFWNFFQGLQSYYGLKGLHKFAHFKGLRLFFLSNFPEATFIQGATSILDSRVCSKIVFTWFWLICPKKLISHVRTFFLATFTLDCLTQRDRGSQHILNSMEANEGALFSVWSNALLAVWPHDTVQIIRGTNSNQSRETYH